MFASRGDVLVLIAPRGPMHYRDLIPRTMREQGGRRQPLALVAVAIVGNGCTEMSTDSFN